MPDGIFAGLNDEQAQAVACVSGPVVILAGAGSGKTTTVTRRIAHQVAGGTHRPERILAVTFTDKAAREMGSRLAALGFPGVRVKTFHAEALAQYRTLSLSYVNLGKRFQYALQGYSQTQFFYGSTSGVFYDPSYSPFISRDLATTWDSSGNEQFPSLMFDQQQGSNSPAISASSGYKGLLVGGLQDNGSVYVPGVGGRWQSIIGGDGFRALVAQGGQVQALEEMLAGAEQNGPDGEMHLVEGTHHDRRRAVTREDQHPRLQHHQPHERSDRRTHCQDRHKRGEQISRCHKRRHSQENRRGGKTCNQRDDHRPRRARRDHSADGDESGGAMLRITQRHGRAGEREKKAEGRTGIEKELRHWNVLCHPEARRLRRMSSREILLCFACQDSLRPVYISRIEMMWSRRISSGAPFVLKRTHSAPCDV